jgi:hypothetical protein
MRGRITSRSARVPGTLRGTPTLLRAGDFTEGLDRPPADEEERRTPGGRGLPPARSSCAGSPATTPRVTTEPRVPRPRAELAREPLESARLCACREDPAPRSRTWNVVCLSRGRSGVDARWMVTHSVPRKPTAGRIGMQPDLAARRRVRAPLFVLPTPGTPAAGPGAFAVVHAVVDRRRSRSSPRTADDPCLVWRDSPGSRASAAGTGTGVTPARRGADGVPRGGWRARPAHRPDR